MPEPTERVIRIDDVDDPRVADYRELREADLAGRRDAFIAESEVVLRVLVARGRFPIRSVFLAESRLDKVADARVSLDPSVPVYVAPQAILSAVVGFRFHRGIVASGQRRDRTTPAEVLADPPTPCRVMVLEGLTNHDNVGGIFRNAAAFGASALLLDPTTCDPLYRKAIRVSVGGSLVVPYARATSTAEAIAATKEAGFTTVALSPSPTATPMEELFADGAPSRVALMVGTEGPGLTAESMAAADVVCRIEMAPGFDSLNVGTATGIALHRVLARQRGV